MCYYWPTLVRNISGTVRKLCFTTDLCSTWFALLCKSPGRWFTALARQFQFLLPLLHLVRVHILYDVRDLQHATFFGKFEDEQYPLAKVSDVEKKGDFRLSRTVHDVSSVSWARWNETRLPERL